MVAEIEQTPSGGSGLLRIGEVIGHHPDQFIEDRGPHLHHANQPALVDQKRSAEPPAPRGLLSLQKAAPAAEVIGNPVCWWGHGALRGAHLFSRRQCILVQPA
jgi:hypothetical protein